MKNVKKLVSYVVVFVVMMAAFCTVSFAADGQYTENLIPTMTSNTSPSGIVTASSEYTGGEAWRAFDKKTGVNGNTWYSVNPTGWLAYEFTTPQIITKYVISNDATVPYMGFYPKNWTFEAWDGAKWVVVDTRTNVSDWKTNFTKEFTFNNTTAYSKYRINITANGGATGYTINLEICELEMMGPTILSINAPANLTAIPYNAKVDLSWDAVEGATSYNIKRATTAGGPYTTIVPNVTDTTYQDTTVTNGTTYYYVVTAVNTNGESTNSNEVTATPKASNQLKLVLDVNTQKQLSVTDELSDNTEIDWTSSDSTIATVDVNGKVKALKSGNTVITCTSKDKSYTESINVLVVDLDYKLAVDLTVGDKCRLTVDDLANATNVIWSSYDSTIATVTTKGKVTAISEGLTYIVASDKDGKEIGRIYIRVRQ